jgi:hypothetical protein
VVGLPHFWQFNVIPAAAESTTNEAEQLVQAKTISLLDFGAEMVEPLVCCIEQWVKQETYRSNEEVWCNRDEICRAGSAGEIARAHFALTVLACDRETLSLEANWDTLALSPETLS